MEEFGIDPDIKVLVVDDSDTIRKIVSDQLRRLGVKNVLEAFSGKKALAVLNENPGVSLIISDWNMPGMQGIDFLKEVRGREELKDIPFLMVTAEKTKAHVVKAVQAGVTDFLAKPFTAEMLESKILKSLKAK